MATHGADERVLGSRMACLISPFDRWVGWFFISLLSLQKLQNRGAMRRFWGLVGRELTGYSINHIISNRVYEWTSWKGKLKRN